MNIDLDIETLPDQSPKAIERISKDAQAEKDCLRAPSNYKDADKIAAYIAARHAEIDAGIDEKWRKTALDGAYGQIAVAGIAFDDEPPEAIYYDQYRDNEIVILKTLFGAIQDRTARSERDYGSQFIGHNIIGFDLRFLFHRAVILGVKPPPALPFDAKPWDGTVFDTMQQWAGAGKTVSLDKLCNVFGLPTKGSEIGEEIDGSNVWDFVKAGRISDVAKYCKGDVERVRAIHKRMTFSVS